jgi:hypothetical protein
VNIIKAVPIRDYYHHPHLAPTGSAWPHMTAADGQLPVLWFYGEFGATNESP